MSDDEQTQLIEDVKAIAKRNSDGTSPTPVLEMASALAGMFQRAEKPHQALRVYREIADALVESEGNTNDAVITRLRVTADLAGTRIEAERDSDCRRRQIDVERCLADNPGVDGGADQDVAASR